MTAHGKKPWRKVVYVGGAPTRRDWCLELECGHWSMRSRRKPRPKKVRCWSCT